MNLVNKIISQALVTFRNTDKFALNFEKLLSATKSLSVEDVGLSDVAKKASFSRAPVTHVNIYEGPYFTVGIFIIRNGHSIPLHDHPSMTGICKVLYGQVQIVSYQHVNNSDVRNESDDIVLVKKLPTMLAGPSSDCQVLTSKHGNFHSISAVDGDAAIFDILAPPYSNSRDCSYYEEHSDLSLNGDNINTSSETNCLLVKVPQPMHFYCDSLPYTGPRISV